MRLMPLTAPVSIRTGSGTDDVVGPDFVGMLLLLFACATTAAGRASNAVTPKTAAKRVRSLIVTPSAVGRRRNLFLSNGTAHSTLDPPRSAQPVFLERVHHVLHHRAAELADRRGIRGLAAAGPDELVVRERVDLRLDRYDLVFGHVAAGVVRRHPRAAPVSVERIGVRVPVRARDVGLALLHVD